MQIERINLREKFDRARHGFDTQLAEVLLSRSDLSHAQIAKEFGISGKVIRRVIKQFNIGARRRGPKPRLRIRGLNNEVA